MLEEGLKGGLGVDCRVLEGRLQGGLGVDCRAGWGGRMGNCRAVEG